MLSKEHYIPLGFSQESLLSIHDLPTNKILYKHHHISITRARLTSKEVREREREDKFHHKYIRFCVIHQQLCMSAACHFAMLTSSTYHHCILHEPGVHSRHSHTGQSRRCWGELLRRTKGSRSDRCHCRKEMTPTIKALSSHSNAVATTHPKTSHNIHRIANVVFFSHIE